MKLKLPKLSKKKRIGIIAALVAAVILFVFIFGSCMRRKAANITVEYEPYTVAKGDIVVSVTGSGTVEPIEQYEIQSIVTGDIIEDHLNVGDTVAEDQILYVIDSESAQNSIERSEASYEQQLISYEDKLKNHNEAEANRSVRAPIGGVITEMYVKDGDEVNTGTKLCEIKSTENLTVSVPFLSANAKAIKLNQTATVFFDDRNESHTGYVSHVATGTYATEAGAIVSDIEITFKNPGAILPGETVTATVGSFACNDTGTVEEADNEVITAKVSGDVKLLGYNKGDKVGNGNVILNIVDDSSSSDMRSSELSLKNSRLSLDDQIEKLNDYTIRSPIAGTVISKTMKAGDTLDGNKSSLAIVADMSKLTFEISVDELYIQNIEVGQTVTVTADALEGRVFEGTVDTVSIIGTPSNGVTVYPVSVVISEYDGLLPGMNVDAQIVISDASDVLMIPVNSVTRGNLVLVKDDAAVSGISKEPSENDKNKGDNKDDSRAMRLPEAPDGYKYVTIETGEANDNYVEVKNGLKEGDVVYVATVKNTQAATQSPFGMGGGMGGGMPGGMPSGGMPSSGGMGSSRGGMSGSMPSGASGSSRGGMSGGGMR